MYLLYNEPILEGVHKMEATTSFGVAALGNICISLVCIFLTWRVLLHIRVEKWLRVPNAGYVRALLLLLSIAIGHQVASFFIDYIEWTRLITQTLFGAK